MNIFGNYPEDEKGIIKHLIDDDLPALLAHSAFSAERRNDTLYIPELDMTLRPSVNIVKANNRCQTNIGFEMYSGKWDKRFYEMCSGMGKDVKSAVGMSLSSFVFAFVEGLERTFSKDEPIGIESEYLGGKHGWNVYISNILGTGHKEETNTAGKTKIYWDLLKDDIIKRLGNQKLVYVKVFAANVSNGENVIGEVRIDDIPVPELGDKVCEIARKWQGGKNVYLSEKQFFFIEQKQETLIGTPYSGKAGREAMKKAVVKFLEMFNSADDEEKYDSLIERAGEAIGDEILAWECFNFLPEICASHAFDGDILINGNVVIRRPDGSEIKEYLHRLTDYYPLQEIFMDIMRENIFGEDSNKIYSELVSVSSIYSCISQAEENRSSGPLTLMHMLFFADEEIIMR